MPRDGEWGIKDDGGWWLVGVQNWTDMTLKGVVSPQNGGSKKGGERLLFSSNEDFVRKLFVRGLLLTTNASVMFMYVRVRVRR